MRKSLKKHIDERFESWNNYLKTIEFVSTFRLIFRKYFHEHIRNEKRRKYLAIMHFTDFKTKLGLGYYGKISIADLPTSWLFY